MGAISSAQWNYEKNIVQYLGKVDKHLRDKVEIILGGGFKVDLPEFKNIENVKFLRSFEDLDKMLIGLK
jgi:hypothetical protein